MGAPPQTGLPPEEGGYKLDAEVTFKAPETLKIDFTLKNLNTWFFFCYRNLTFFFKQNGENIVYKKPFIIKYSLFNCIWSGKWKLNLF